MASVDLRSLKLESGELDIEALKSRIQGAVARREAEGKASFINASAELFKVLTADDVLWDNLASPDFQATALSPGVEELSLIRLQPEFSLRADDHYHVNDLLQYHDSAFVWNAYRAILKREPDEEGFQAYLELLRSGRRNKIDILAGLHRSREGKRAQVSIDGLTVPAMIRRLYRLPLVGYLLELTVALARLPVLMRSQRQMENHLVAQQDRVAGHFNYTNRQLADQIDRVARGIDEESRRSDSLQDTLAKLLERQHRITTIQHQQVAALFSRLQKQNDNNRSIAKSTAHRHGTSVDTNQHSRSSVLPLDKLEAAFADQFRGTPEAVKEDLRSYLPLLQETGVTAEILDLGCGRGEWLDLLRDEGLRAEGVESNRTLVAEGRNRGLEITHQEAIEYLSGLANNSLRAVTAFHLIEHLEFERLLELLIEIRRTLKPGGVVILETPNPKNLVVGACNFYADPTHHKPIFPETLQFLMKELGFAQTRIEYQHPVEESPFDNSEPGSQELHAWLFGPRDYTAIGWKA